MKKINVFFKGACIALILLSSGVLEAQVTRIRTNNLGYRPEADKRLVIISDEDCKGKTLTIRSTGGALVRSYTVEDTIAGKGMHTPKAFNHEVYFSDLRTPGTYVLDLEGLTSKTIQIQASPFEQLAHDVLRVIRVRRSGSDDAIDHAFSHGGDSTAPVYAHNGTSSWDTSSWNKPTGQEVNLLGGWYDAGDYIKFTATVSYTAYNLLTAYRINPEMFNAIQRYSSTEDCDMLDEIKWGLDYLMKTMPDDNTFIIQIGGVEDHNAGVRLPEDDELDGKRRAYSTKSKSQMGINAAALALGYNVFKDIDKDLADTYLTKAKAIYAQAKPATIESGHYAVVGDNHVFYADSDCDDNMQLAATELYIATLNASYLADAKAYADVAQGGYWSSWCNVNMKANHRLAPYYTVAKNHLSSELNYFNGKINSVNNIWNIPHDYVWGSLYSQLGVAASAITFDSEQTVPPVYGKMVNSVLDYTFGLNNWGLGFIVTKRHEGAIETSYSDIYRIKKDIFPTGEIAEGPVQLREHEPQRYLFSSPGHNNELPIRGTTTDKFKDFNTDSSAYFENEVDFVCSETTISGLSDGVLLLALADKIYGSSLNAAPTVNITSPANGEVLTPGSTLVIKANASDPENDLDRVVFYGMNASGVRFTLDTAFAAPYECVVNKVPAGSYTLEAIAFDVEGKMSEKSAVSITVMKPAIPVVKITSPNNGDVLVAGTDLTIKANASAATSSTIEKVEFFGASKNNGVNYSLCTDIDAPYECVVNKVPAGNFTLKAVATDNQGKVSDTSYVDIIVEKNPAPEVNITSPISGTVYMAGDDLLITANASDNVSVAKVVFYAQDKKSGVQYRLCQRFIIPYECSVLNLPAGEFILKAIAVDNEGKVSDTSYTDISVITPKADFTVVPEVCQGESVVFKDNSQGRIDAYTWNFGTGATPSTATGQGPHTVTYSETGIRMPSLTVTTNGHSDVVEKQIQVQTCTNEIAINLVVDQDWGTGMSGYIEIANNTTSVITAWELIFNMGSTITSAWNCVFNGTKPYVFNNPSWDNNFAPQTTRTIGFNGTYAGTILLPDEGTFNGQPVAITSIVTAPAGAANTQQFTDDTNEPKSANPIEELTEILVAPNPATNFLNITVPKAETFKVEVISLSGAVVSNIAVTGNKTTIDINHYNPGIYTVVVKASSRVSRTRLIVR